MIYTPFAPAEGAAQSRGEVQAANAAIALDYWDGRPSREAHFAQLLRTRLPRAEVRDLTPILDELRSVKSPREIALIRRASQLAGRGIIEAIKSTRPGATEYQLDAVARYVFLANGSRLEGYRSITASGIENIWNMHYYRNLDTLKDGDLVLMDFAPDYRYYVSDIARMWPVNGKYSPEQRELLQFVLDYRNCILARLRPGVTPAAIQEGGEGGDGGRLQADPVLEAGLRAGRPEARRDRRRGLLAPRRHGRPRRRRLQPGAAQARSRLLDRPPAPRAGREALHPLRGRGRDHRERLRELHGLLAQRAG